MKNNQIYMPAKEVAEELGVSVGHAYKLIRTLNQEMKKQGYIVISGKIDRRYFHDKVYATKNMGGDVENGSISG